MLSSGLRGQPTAIFRETSPRARERDRDDDSAQTSERAVGIWSLSHYRSDMYGHYDASCWSLAPTIALSLSLEPDQAVLDSSERIAQHVEALSAATEQLHASSEESAGSAKRMAMDVKRLADTLSAGEERSQITRSSADGNVAEGQSTQKSGEQMVQDARVVRDATVEAHSQLMAAAAIVQEGAEEVASCKRSAAVQRFGQPIPSSPTNRIAGLNASVEAARAGVPGAVSRRSAGDPRPRRQQRTKRRDRPPVRGSGQTLDRAAALSREARGSPVVANASQSWGDELDRILAKAEALPVCQDVASASDTAAVQQSWPAPSDWHVRMPRARPRKPRPWLARAVNRGARRVPQRFHASTQRQANNLAAAVAMAGQLRAYRNRPRI